MSAVIFCGGEIESYDYLRNRDFDGLMIICADGGLNHLKRLGITPHIVIGDNDSVKTDVPKGVKVISYPVKKDYTDTNLCIDYAIEKGHKEIEIIGGLGGRLDHEYANICMLAYGLKKGVKIKLTNERNEIYIEDKPFKLKKTDKEYVSFFPFGGDVEGFSVKGLEYEAENIKLECNKAQASSNRFGKEDICSVDFKRGIVLVIMSSDK